MDLLARLSQLFLRSDHGGIWRLHCIGGLVTLGHRCNVAYWHASQPLPRPVTVLKAVKVPRGLSTIAWIRHIPEWVAAKDGRWDG